MKMPPDLSEAARPLDVLPPQSCGETISSSPPTECTSSSNGTTGAGLQSQYYFSHGPVAENFASSNGSVGQFQQPPSQIVGSEVGKGGRECNGKGAETQVSSPFINMYHLTPALRATFASVGATDRAYQFKEVLLLLKNYLFSKIHLFDAKDNLFVNCGNDPLGKALQVDRFHYTDVGVLISKNIIRVLPEFPYSETKGSPSVPVASDATCVQIKQNSLGEHSADKYAAEGKSTTSINNFVTSVLSETNGRTEVLVPTRATTSEHLKSSETLIHSRELQHGQNGSLGFSSAPGPSRESQPGWRRPSQTAGFIPYKFTLCDNPESNSDAESVYSMQGYETALCHNTEFEDTDVEAELEAESYEEYEIASDDDKEQEQSDDDDSVIEDVEVVFSLPESSQDELEEDFWADDSDTDDQSIDNDLELIPERWDCLICGLKKTPFVPYCEKCWQLRKSWLPDPPKRRKRKPRPKKKHSRRRSDSVQSDDQLGTKNAIPEENHSIGSTLCSNSGSNQDLEELPRTSSTASTVSFESDSPNVNCFLGQCSSQDSGISLSQDILIDFSDECQMGKSRSNTIDFKVTEAQLSAKDLSTSQEASTSSGKSSASTTPSNASSRKRKLSHSENVGCHKRARPSEVSELGEESDSSFNVDIKAKAKAFDKLLEYAPAREWVRSAVGMQFLSSSNKQEVNFEEIVANKSMSSSAFESLESSEISNLCVICCLRPRNGSIAHGRIAHVATCYQCARRLLNSGSRCPVCRRKIHMVCKIITL
ncbi:E3 ubiquitin-protein ligase Mdm2 isoform X2 [Cherax quadricarinatus]|nr:E3 ubiquitin-protein ligase Mdm2-like isoform X2 [Cherax quadricarinatus]